MKEKTFNSGTNAQVQTHLFFKKWEQPKKISWNQTAFFEESVTL